MANQNKLTTRSRGWCFTINFPDEEELQIFSRPIPNAQYTVYQFEQGELGGHRHIQGYVYFKNARMGSSIRKTLRDWCGGYEAHFDIANGTGDQNKTYCTKEETRIPDTDPYEFGDMPEDPKLQGGKGAAAILQLWDVFKVDGRITEERMQNNPVAVVQYGRRLREIKDEIEHEHWEHKVGYNPKKIIILYGETGTGKTRTAMEDGAIKAKYSSRYTWGHYRGEKVVCFDEFNGQVNIEEILELTDGYATTVQIPYMGNKPWIPETIYFCSNTDYLSWWEKAKPEQLRSFWRRVTTCIKFTKTGLGTLKSYQKGQGEGDEEGAVEVIPAPEIGPYRVTADEL